MKKIIIIGAVAVSLSGCSFFGGYDYLSDVTKDTHSGCFQEATNYLGFTHAATYIHLGDNAAAMNASPNCAGITSSSGGALPASSGSSGVIPAQPAPVGTKTGQ